ncbi:GPW/gp25 family protein [Streptomyces sp. NPDC001530]|uniref:GPW/gp25 family protein n=1 Tax=Streptomyces sp. NPDC001530 TaxID=3364582 RepID=UPI003682F4D2
MDVDFPFHFDSSGRTARTGGDEHVRDMIEQFLFTSAGERVNRPGFGSGLLRMVFDPNSAELAPTLELTIQSGLLQWLGDLIEVRSVDVTSVDARLGVSVEYVVLRSGAARTDRFVREAS